jgi:hypothetical protein
VVALKKKKMDFIAARAEKDPRAACWPNFYNKQHESSTCSYKDINFCLRYYFAALSKFSLRSLLRSKVGMYVLCGPKIEPENRLAGRYRMNNG